MEEAKRTFHIEGNDMALSPDAARGLTAEDLELVSLMEKEIDKFLISEVGRRRGSVPSFQLERELPSHKIIDELIRRYQAAGWNRVALNAGRDGTCLQFYDFD